MMLPDDSIGISDILAYRECPQRFAYGMRRHVELPEHLQVEPGEKDEPPESTNWTNAYGLAIHAAIAEVVRGAGHREAIDAALAQYGIHLTPADVALLSEDLKIYEARKPKSASLVAAERDLRVPLFIDDDGTQIYYRFRLDVLYRLDNYPDVFLHRDYKSSAHRKTAAEVHADVQLWSYNWAIHELWPECRRLFQEYDQLKFGVERTSKSPEQREQMRPWLIGQVRVILADETFKPRLNDFCPYCPLAVTCRETQRATRFWRGRLALVAPLGREGRKIKVQFRDEAQELEQVIRELPEMQKVRKHIQHVEDALKDVIVAMALEDRERVGWLVRERHSKTITPEGLRELHAMLGDAFYRLINLPIGRLEEFVGKPKKGDAPAPELKLARDWSVEQVSDSIIVPVKS
jgi:PD-(D/E)XK nuclease superfamily